MFAPAALGAWDEPLTADERERLIEKLARAVVDRGLQTPTILALEMHKPLAFIAAQTLIVTTPLVGPLVGMNRMQAAGRLLQEPGAVEAVIERIESLTTARDAAKRDGSGDPSAPTKSTPPPTEGGV